MLDEFQAITSMVIFIETSIINAKYLMWDRCDN